MEEHSKDNSDKMQEQHGPPPKKDVVHEMEMPSQARQDWQNENYQILKESFELKSQMQESAKTKAKQYDMAMLIKRHQEDMRRYYTYQARVVEQQRSKLMPGNYHHQTIAPPSHHYKKDDLHPKSAPSFHYDPSSSMAPVHSSNPKDDRGSLSSRDYMGSSSSEMEMPSQERQDWQNENYQILKESFELKSQMEEMDKTKAKQYDRAMLIKLHQEDMRRYYTYQARVIEQQRSELNPGIYHHPVEPSTHPYKKDGLLAVYRQVAPNLSSLPHDRSSSVAPDYSSDPKGGRDSVSSRDYMGSSSSKNESSSSSEGKRSKAESEGQKPTMETTGPPPLPTNSTSYLPPPYVHPHPLENAKPDYSNPSLLSYNPNGGRGSLSSRNYMGPSSSEKESSRDYMESSSSKKESSSKDYMGLSSSNKESSSEDYMESSSSKIESSRDYMGTSSSKKESSRDYMGPSSSEKESSRDYMESSSSEDYIDPLSSKNESSSRDYMGSSTNKESSSRDFMESLSREDYMGSSSSEKDYIDPLSSKNESSSRDCMGSSSSNEESSSRDFMESSSSKKDYMRSSSSKKDYMRSSSSNKESSSRDFMESSSSEKDYMRSSSSKIESSNMGSPNSKKESSEEGRGEKKRRKAKRVASEGKRPNSESMGPPPPFNYTFSYNDSMYLPPQYAFAHMAFTHAAMYQGGINPKIMSPHFTNFPYPLNPQIRYRMPPPAEQAIRSPTPAQTWTAAAATTVSDPSVVPPSGKGSSSSEETGVQEEGP